jgi:hypothetical protein
MDQTGGLEMKATIREYTDELPVVIQKRDPEGRLVIKAFNEAGFNFTMVDLLDLLVAVKTEMPETWEEANRIGQGVTDESHGT